MMFAEKFVVSASAASTTIGDGLSTVDSHVSLSDVRSLSALEEEHCSDQDLWEARCSMLPSSATCCPWMSPKKALWELREDEARFDMLHQKVNTTNVFEDRAGHVARSDVSLNGSLMTRTVVTAVAPAHRFAPAPQAKITDVEELNEEDQERMRLYSAACRLKLWLGVLEGLGSERPQLDDDVLAALSMVDVN